MTASFLDRVTHTAGKGLFLSALQDFEEHGAPSIHPQSDTLSALRAELLQRTGANERAASLSKLILKRDNVAPSVKARCHVVLALVALDETYFVEALKHFRRSMRAADSSGDLELLAEIQLEGLTGLSDVSRSETPFASTAEVRANVLRHGSIHLTVRLHLHLAEAEAVRGYLGNAARHINEAEQLLLRDENSWLSGVAALNASTIDCMRSDLEAATRNADRALQYAELSGHHRTRVGANANLGLLNLYAGQLQEASLYLERAKTLANGARKMTLVLLDSFAQLRLAQDRVPECEQLLEELGQLRSRAKQFRPSWYEMATYPTLIKLQQLKENWPEALSCSETGGALADARRDPILGLLFRVLQADALLALDRVESAAKVIAEASDMSAGAPIATLAELERVKGKALAKLGSHDDARRNFERAVRMLSVVGHVQARETASADYAAATNGGELLSGNIGGAGGFQEAESLFVLASNAELFAREAYATLQAEGYARCCALWVTRNGRPLELLLNHGWTRTQALNEARRASDAKRWALGSLGERSFFMVAEAADGLPAYNGLTTFRHLVELAAQLEAFREDERRRRSLWPADTPANREDGIYVAAQTVENFAMAKRIASSKATVLLSGDTGTGKEVLARAIHRHSDRRDKAFLPFNCQAVPRDMLDSQLFGHRRGAFTGAQENFQGVIRAAAGGTLFLDEIAELALDVQPKLLRFLESGEIHPLGESRPLTVDVRVISATNAPLEKYVSEGRFREDLYYRLNVVRFRMPPLRERREEIPPLVHQFLQRYAQEENKGRLRLAEETLEYLLLYPWPGNVRQLANEVRRLVSIADANATLRPEDLSPEILAARRTVPASPPAGAPTLAEGHLSVNLDQPLGLAVAELERAIINRALGASGGRVEHAARTLKISRKGLFLKRRRLGVKGAA